MASPQQDLSVCLQSRRLAYELSVPQQGFPMSQATTSEDVSSDAVPNIERKGSDISGRPLALLSNLR